MRKKFFYQVFASILVVVMVLSLGNPLSTQAKATEPQSIVTVDQEVLDEVDATGAASYWINFRSKVDLSPAYEMDWSERGWYVYDQLSKIASESQADVLAYLDSAQINYQSYWIKNTILVESSGLTVLNALQSFPEVESIGARKEYVLYEPDTSEAVQDSGVNAVEPNLTHINADDAWALGITGEGLVVASIDTGVRYTHEALVNQYRGNEGDGTFTYDYNWFDPYGEYVVPTDANGHGTHTMGTMVGDDGGSNQIGIAPEAEWMACRGCNSSSCTEEALLTCGQFIAAPTTVAGTDPNPDMRPNVVNNSWGDCGTSYDPWYADVIDAWLAVGTYPVFSNGNSSNCGYASPPGLNTVGNPARSGNVTGVGSSGEQNGQYATHSNWGPTDNLDTVNPTDGFDMMKPQVLAPGVSIRSSVPTSDTSYEDGWSGTSMSAPHVTGLVALVWQAAPCLVGDYATTENLIESTAVDIVYDDGSALTPTNSPNFATGWGEIDALAAVNQALGVCSMGTVNGTITDGTNPIEGATVRADDGAGYTRTILTAADGTYTLGLPAGTYTVTASKYGFETVTVTDVVIAEDQTLTQNFTLPPLGMTLVSGNIYDGGIGGVGSHGYPLYSSIHITAPGFDQTIYADPITGYYEVSLVEATEHTFTVNAVPAGYEILVETVTPVGTAYPHDITLLADAEACAAPGYQPDYDIFYNFESSDGGFTPGGTTSFAWGDFTSGPGEGHSGTKGIATNPGGSYNASEQGWMVSPVIDLTGFGTDTPVIQWYDYKDIESASYDWGRVDVTKDGGTTWTTVYGPVGGVHDTQYNQQTIVLDSTYNVSNFQFRFYFKSDTSVQYTGWYIDDIGIFNVAVPAPTVIYSNNFDSDNGGFTVSGTTSWAWGAPTSGPSAPYSIPNVWATNLAGNYGSSEAGWITSPVIDLSAYAGLAPTISFQHWNDIESTSFDWGAVEATKDGGATWQDVSCKIGDVTTWTQKTIALDSTYAVSDFQFRFYFRSDGSGNYAGWYIDDVAVSVATPVVITAPCIIIPGGAVAGYVYDDNSGDPLVGANVVSPTVATQTFELAGDPDNAGLYWVFQPTTTSPEDVVFTASKDLYGNGTATVSVAQDEVTQQDFALGTGRLSFDPTSFEVTMQMDDVPSDQALTISNAGTADATFELVEKDKGYLPAVSIPAFTDKLIESTVPTSIGPAPKTATTPALSSADLFEGVLAGEPAFAADLFEDALVYIPDTTTPGTWTVVGGTMSSLYSGDFISGDFSTLYAISGDTDSFYTVDTATGAYTLIGPSAAPAGQSWTGLTGTPDGTLYGLSTDISTTNLTLVDPSTGAVTDLGALSGIAAGIDLAYNTNEDMIYIVDIVSNELYRVDPATLAVTAVGALGVDANYAQGLDYEEETGILYWAAYTTVGELRVIDMTTGASALVGGFPDDTEVDSLAFATGGAGDVSWLSESPTVGTVPSAGSTDVTLSFDPASLGQPGDYLAALKVKHNTPYTYSDISATLHLLRPSTWGTLEGTVYALEACDVNPTPLKDATVNIYDDLGTLLTTLSTDADGNYSWSLLAGTYTLEVIMDGYQTELVEGLIVDPDATLATDVELRLLAPCLSVDPTSFEQWLGADLSATQTLSLINAGAAAGDFTLSEMADAGIATAADVELILDDGSAENGIGIGGTLEFIWLNRFTPEEDAFPFNLDEIQVYFDSSGNVSVGDEIILVVYENIAGNPDPAVGATLLYSYPTTVQAVDDWNNYTLPEGVLLEGPGDVLIGVIGMEKPGSSYWPASIDEDASQGRSWAGWWSASPPTPPELPPDESWGLIDDFGFPGNWMVRGMGSSAAVDIIWLSEDPVTGTVPADSTSNVTLTFDATDQELGDYSGLLKVKNAPQPAIEIPVTLHVVPAAEAFDQDLTTPESTPLEITLNAVDPESDPLTYVIVDGPTHGTLEYEANELPVLTYIPNTDWYGEDTFTFKATDGLVESNIATVTIDVTSVNYPPLANDDHYATDEGVELVVPAPGVLGNDNENDPLDRIIADLEDEPAHGTVNLKEDGSFTYVPDAGYLGEDSFTYNMLGIPPEMIMSQYADEATVYIMVNTKPIANDQNLATVEDKALPITLTGDFLTPGPEVWTVKTQPAHGTLSGTEPNLVYTPESDWFGTDSFTFSVNDGIYESDIATITVEVTPVNDAPKANDDFYTIGENLILEVLAPGVLENDYDPDPSDAILADVKTNPMHGTLTLNSDGSFTYIPDAGYVGTDIFEYYMLATPSPSITQSELVDWATVTIVVGSNNVLYLPMLFK